MGDHGDAGPGGGSASGYQTRDFRAERKCRVVPANTIEVLHAADDFSSLVGELLFCQDASVSQLAELLQLRQKVTTAGAGTTVGSIGAATGRLPSQHIGALNLLYCGC